MKNLVALALSLLLVTGCSGFPTTNPPDESFTTEELQIWKGAEEDAPSTLVGTWRLIDQRSDSGNLLWFQFTEDGFFVSANDSFFAKKQAEPRWRGAYRVSDKTIVCQYQQKDGNDSWLKKRDGKGQVFRYPFYLKDKNTLIMKNVSKQKLTLKYHRAVGKADE